MTEDNENKRPENEKNKMRKLDRRKVDRIMGFFELLIILLFILGIPALLYLRNPELVENFKSFEAFDAFLMEHSQKSIPYYVASQVIQVVVTFIPGQVVQLVGGYIYGVLLATLLSLVGIAIGTCISFTIARLFGKRPLRLLFGEERFEKYNELLGSRKAYRIIFLLYLIPGFPKDMVAYAAGVSKIKILPFLLLSLIGRTPAMVLTMLMGDALYAKNFVEAGIIAAVALVLFIICILKRDRLFEIGDKWYEKVSK